MSSREPHGIRAPLEEPPGRPRQHCCRRTSRRPHRGCSSHPASPRSLSHARSAVQMDEVPVNISSRHVTGVGAGRRRRAARSVPGGIGAMRITYAGRCTCSAHALAALLAAASVTAREVSPKDAAPCSATMHHHKSIHHGARKEMRACKSSCRDVGGRRFESRDLESSA